MRKKTGMEPRSLFLHLLSLAKFPGMMVACFLFFSLTLTAGIQPLYDEELDRTGQLLLGMRLDEADSLIANSIERNRERPAGYFFKSAALSWRLFLAAEGSDTKKLKKEFESAVEDSRRVAENTRSRKESRFEGTIYLGAVYGQEALLAMLDRRYLVMAPLSRQALIYIEEAISIDPQYYDCYLGTGIYKYFTAVLPGAVKILAEAFGFPADREGGLSDLRLALERGLYSRDAAGVMLMNIYSLTEIPDSSAGALAAELYRRYPDNPLIHWRYGDILYRLKKYFKAQEIYQQVEKRIESDYPFYRNSMFSAWSISFRLAMCDRKQGRDQEALKRLSLILSGTKVTPDWIVPVSCLVCGEIYFAQGNHALAEKNLRAVLQYDDYNGSRKRAETLLEQLKLQAP